jgi:hypothetical protein
MIYILIGGLLILFSFDEIVKKRKSRLTLVFSCVIIWLLAGLRTETGTDWYNYYSLYKETTDRVEIGYAFLNNLFSKLNIQYNLFLLMINGMAIALMYKFIKGNAYLVIIGLLIFFSDSFLYYNLSGIRQGIALSIVCFGFKYALNKDYKKFILIIVLACCFHLSAFIFVFAYFIPRHKLSFRFILIILIFIISGTFLLQKITDFITLNTIKDAQFYINQQTYEFDVNLAYYIGAIKRSIMIILCLIYGSNMFKNSNSRYFFNIYLLGLVIYLSLYKISPDLGTRLSSYFTIFEIILSGNLIYFNNKFPTRFFLFFLFVFMAVYKIIGYMYNERYEYNLIFNVF